MQPNYPMLFRNSYMSSMRVVLQTALNMLPKASILLIIDRNEPFVLIMCFVLLFNKKTGSSKI
jgi:hypothetical protein